MFEIKLYPPRLDSRDPRGQCSVGLSLTEDQFFAVHQSIRIRCQQYVVHLLVQYARRHSFVLRTDIYVVSLPHTYDEIPPPVVANETFATPWQRCYAGLINANAVMQLCTTYAEVSDRLAYLPHPDIT